MMCACHTVPLFGAPDTFIRVGKPGPRTHSDGFVSIVFENERPCPGRAQREPGPREKWHGTAYSLGSPTAVRRDEPPHLLLWVPGLAALARDT
jgi:hypothetical protein